VPISLKPGKIQGIFLIPAPNIPQSSSRKCPESGVSGFQFPADPNREFFRENSENHQRNTDLRQVQIVAIHSFETPH
jgi:hypothetical protein